MNPKYIGVFLILLITLGITYFESLQYDFTHWDDYEQVVENNAIKSISTQNWIKLFSSTAVGMYQPVTSLIYSIVYNISNGNSFGFHLASLLLHFMNCILVFKLFLFFKLEKIKAFFLVTIFALHPMQVESVSWVSAFSTLTFTFFGLLAVIYFLKDTKRTYLLSLLFFLLACLSKSAAVFIPIILLFIKQDFSRKNLKKNIIAIIPFLLLSILFGIITIFSRESAGHLSDVSQTFNLFDRIFLISHSYLFYIIKFLFPINLSAFYAFPLKDPYLPILYYLSPIGILALGFLVWKFKNNKNILLGVLWYSVSIFLVLQVISVGSQITTDRYIYFPMIGILMLLIPALKKVSLNKVYFLFTVPLLLAFQSNLRTKVWENDKTLWVNVIENNPSVSQAYNNLASFETDKGNLRDAMLNANKALELRPNYADAFANRANIYSQVGKYDLALADYNRSLSLKEHANTYLNRANLFNKTGELKKALSDYSKSLELAEKEDVYTNRAFCYLKLNLVEDAIKDLNSAIKLNPKYNPALYLLGMTYVRNNNYSKGCSLLREANKFGNKKAAAAIKQYCLNK